MKVLFFVALACAILWSGFVVFANMMRSSSTGTDFIGAGTIATAWLIVGIIAIVTWSQ